MRYNPFSIHSFLWITQILVEVATVRLLWKDRRQWPVFTVFLSLHLCWDLCLFPLAISHHPKLYFYCYWWGRFALFILECLSIGKLIAKILGPVTRVSAGFTSLLFLAAAMLCGAGWNIAGSAATRKMLPITKFVLYAERGLTTVEAICILFFVCIVSLAALRWTQTEAFVTAGFITQALSSMLSSALLAFCSPSYGNLIQLVLGIADVLTFSFWMVAFLPILQITPQRLIGDVE